MKFPLPAVVRFVCLVSLTAAASGAPDFSRKPEISKTGGKITIRFSLSTASDVEIAVLDAEGKVVRHLAAGVLGGESPPPAPLAPGLSQEILWNGLDDYGKPVPDISLCRVRVRIGMETRLNRIAGGNPYAYHSPEMGQGDHAAWRITGLEVKDDGKVYVLGNANNYGPAALRQYSAKGEFQSTIYPPPAGKELDSVRGWGIYELPDNLYSFRPNDLDSPALTTAFISGNRGRIANLIPSPEPGQLLLERDHRLMKINTDGTIDPAPLVEGQLVNEPAMSPEDKVARRGPWRLTGEMQTALSPDKKHLYLSGIFAGTLEKTSRIGAEKTGHWRDGQIFKIDLSTRKAEVFFALPEESVITDLKARAESPIADARYGNYAALQGVAVDDQGRVFICDRQNERILILDPGGKALREIPISQPDAIAVVPKSSVIYVTTRAGHYHGKGELRLHKFGNWPEDTEPAQSLTLCEVHKYSQPTRLAIAMDHGDVYLWVAYTQLPVRVYRDRGAELELVNDFAVTGNQRALDLQHMAVDQETGDAYIADGFNRCFRITDWENPEFELCLQGEQVPLRALSIAIDSRNRRLYAHADRSPVTQFHLDGEFLTPIPTGARKDDNAVTPDLTNDWRIGLGFGERGIAVAPDGSLATLAALGKGPDYAGYLRYFNNPANNAVTEGLWFEKLGRFRAAGVRFDLQGNLYVGMASETENIPPEYGTDRFYNQGTGHIEKYSPTGSLKEGNLFPSEPEGPAKKYSVHYGSISNHFARTPRFGVDGYGRIYYPNSLANRVSVIDNEGNVIHTFGTYGNRDSFGGLEGCKVPTKGIPLAWPSSVDVTDKHIFVTDIVNIRLLRIEKTFAAEATIPLAGS